MKLSMIVVLCFSWAVVRFYGDQPHVMWLIPLFASPLLMLYLRVVHEDGLPTGLLSHKRAMWSFLYGDSIVFPAAFFFVSIGYSKTPDDSWAKSSIWWFACALIGVLAGIIFHAVDSKTYKRLGAESALSSPTKLAHDYVAYPVIGSGLLYLGVPALWYDQWGSGAAALVCFAGWVALVYLDETRQNKPKPRDLHPSTEPAYSSYSFK